MKGTIQSVLGPLDPDKLGLTLTHEHLLHSLDKTVFRRPLPIKLSHLQNDFSIQYLGWIRQYPCSFDQNLEYADECVRSAVREEMAFFRSKAGGGTVVDNCSIGLRHPDQMQFITQVSKESGVNIIAGTGFYVAGSQSQSVLKMGVEEMSDIIRQDLTIGIEGVKCGVIGEVGCSWPLEEFEKKSLVSTAIVQQETGAPVIIHPGRDPHSPEEIFRVFQEAGGDVKHTVMSHLDRTFVSQEQLLEFAGTGSYCEYDLFGLEVSFYQLGESIAMPSDAQRIALIKCLVDEGFGDRIVIAHDIHTKHRLMQFGGHGFSHIPLNVVPHMKVRGLTDTDIRNILYNNPRSWLTFN